MIGVFQLFAGLSIHVTVGQALLGVLALVGVLTLLFLASEIFDDWFLSNRRIASQFGFDATPVDRGTPIIDFADEETLRGLATHHKLEAPAAKIERGRKRGLRGGPKVFRGKAENTETETVEPRDDLADLLFRLLRHLQKEGELDQSADCVHAEMVTQPFTFHLEENEAKEFFAAWLDEVFPNGLEGVTPEEMTTALATLGKKTPDALIRRSVSQSFEALQEGEERILLLEGEWATSTSEEGIVRLNRTDLRVSIGNDSFGSKSLPMPTGISIVASLTAEALTAHGRTRMVGVTLPIRATVVATVRAYDSTTGCFELVPIAVFHRLR